MPTYIITFRQRPENHTQQQTMEIDAPTKEQAQARFCSLWLREDIPSFKTTEKVTADGTIRIAAKRKDPEMD